MADEPRDNDINEEPAPAADEEPTRETPRDDDAPRDQPTREVRRFTRSHQDRVVAGVAGGLGRYFGIDPILFRIAFVVLTFTGGVGAIAYLALLAFVPSDDADGTTSRSQYAAVGGTILIGLALLTFLDGPFFFGPGLLFLAVAGVAVVLLWQAVARDGDANPARTLGRIALFGLIAFLVVCLAIGVGIAAALGGGVVIAVLAVVAGVALIAAAFFGGARWLIAPALAIVLPLAVVAAADIDLDGGISDRGYRPATLTELQDRYEVGLGAIDLDLRDLDLPAGRTNVAVDVGIGRAVVWVPSDTCVTSDIVMGAGAADVLDRENGGLDVDLEETAVPSGGRAELHIDADLGLGAIEIVREGFEADWDDHEGFDRFRRVDEVSSAGSERGLNCT